MKSKIEYAKESMGKKKSEIESAMEEYDENMRDYYYLIDKNSVDGKCYNWLPSKLFLVMIIIMLIAKMVGLDNYLNYGIWI